MRDLKIMKRILVIEDNAPLCWLLERMLRGNYHVTMMSNGLDACSWLMDGNTCDLIVSDINMPSLSGIELLQYLRNNGMFNAIPVIILSGLEDSRNECAELGAYSYFVKPFEPQQLYADIKNALSSLPSLQIKSAHAL
jgi:two-component system, chemotaxis family, chemotaxis protein CheY